MDIVSETRFEIQILSRQDVCRSLQIKNCIKTKFLLYLLKYDHAEMKRFIVPFFRSFNLISVSGHLMMPKGAKDTEKQIRPHPPILS